jgi:hypothetical protein
MNVSARREFWIWLFSAAVLVVTALVVASLVIGRGGWWLVLPLLWLAAGLVVAEWVRKRRHSATLAWWAASGSESSEAN